MTAASPPDVRTVVTIVVTHRERFSFCRPSLESLYEHTRIPFALVYVDGGSPAHVRRFLAAEALRRGFVLLRTEGYLAQNAARNLALPRVTTPYVVFMDSDVVVAPGWLDALVRCAEETGAGAVVPVFCIGEPVHQTVHVAGTEIHVVDTGNGRWYRERHALAEMSLAEARPRMRRMPCGGVEFHTVLVRRDVLDQLGTLDTGILGTRDHVDLSLDLRQAGIEIYLEPDAIVTYVPPRRVDWSDVPFYLLRWSDEWNEASLRHLCRKWNFSNDHRVVKDTFLRPHRQAALEPLRRRLVGLAGWRIGNRVADMVEWVIVRYALARWERTPA